MRKREKDSLIPYNPMVVALLLKAWKNGFLKWEAVKSIFEKMERIFPVDLDGGILAHDVYYEFNNTDSFRLLTYNPTYRKWLEFGGNISWGFKYPEIREIMEYYYSLIMAHPLDEVQIESDKNSFRMWVSKMEQSYKNIEINLKHDEDKWVAKAETKSMFFNLNDIPKISITATGDTPTEALDKVKEKLDEIIEEYEGYLKEIENKYREGNED